MGFSTGVLRRTIIALALATLTAGIRGTAVAQTTSGTIIGQVFGEAGRGVAEVKVVAVNEGNSNTRAVRTDQQGVYRFYFLTPGLYTITASHEGYSDGEVINFQVPLNCISPLRPPDITLRPAIATAPAVPPAPQPPAKAAGEGASGVTTTDATRRGNFIGIQLESLPLGGLSDMRTFDEMAFLLPGVSPPPYTPGVRGPGVGFGIGTAGEFSVNGMRARSNNFTVDGSDNNDPDVGVRRQGFVARVPQSIESINEFEISTSLWDAELGRNFGSQPNAVTRGGGNHYHGTAYGFFTDSRLNARNFFDYTDGPSHNKDPFTRFQDGFVIGGPISGNTQFFGSFENQGIHSSAEQHFATPAQADRRFLGLPRFAVLKPFEAADPNQIFSTDRGATPLGLNVLSFYPLPNNPGGPYGADTFTQVLPADGRGDIFSLKVVHQFAQKHTLSTRYNFTDDDRVLPAINRAINSTTKASTRTQDLSLIVDSELGRRFFNDGRFSYGRTRLGFAELPGSPLLFSASTTTSVGVPGGGQQNIPSLTGPMGEVSIAGFSPVGVNAFTFPQARANNTFQVADSGSRGLGPHSIKFGADIRRVQLNSLLDRNFRPQIVYGDAILRTGTLSPVAGQSNPFNFSPETESILPAVQLATLGLPSSIFQTLTLGTPDSTIGLRFTEYNFFVNDNWRVRDNFALDYGVRYEYATVPHETNGRVEQALLLKGLPAPGGSPADTPERTTALGEAVAAYRSVLGGRTQIYDPDRNNLGPHLGFAWDPWSDGKTSVRGGFGVYYDAILGAVVTQSRNVFPTQIPINVEPAFASFDVFVLNSPASLVVQNGARGPITPIPLVKPGTLNQLGGTPADAAALIGALLIQNMNGGGLAFTLPDKHLRTPYAQQWHLTVEREIARDLSVSAAYVGTKGTKLTRLVTPNLGPNVTPSILLATKFSGFPAGFSSPPLVLADCALQGGLCSVAPNRPNPLLGAYQVFENSASSNYHALQVGATKRYSSGYSFTVSYAWSHAIDDVSDVFPIAGAPILPQDSANLRLERASANFDVRQRLVASMMWDLPFYKGSREGIARWLGAWQLTGIFQANTGQPFTLNVPVDANFDGNLTDRPSTTNGLVFADGHTRQRITLSPGSTLNSFFVLGQNSAVGRNTARGDSFINLDMALVKMFRITESQNLHFRAELFNALNRANFGLPIGVIGSPGFGSAVETTGPARLIQFALKYSF